MQHSMIHIKEEAVIAGLGENVGVRLTLCTPKFDEYILLLIVYNIFTFLYTRFSMQLRASDISDT